MGGYGRISHEKVGTDFLRAGGFSEKIAILVENMWREAFSCEVCISCFSGFEQTLIFQGVRTSQRPQPSRASLHYLYIKVRTGTVAKKSTSAGFRHLPEHGEASSATIRHLPISRKWITTSYEKLP